MATEEESMRKFFGGEVMFAGAKEWLPGNIQGLVFRSGSSSSAIFAGFFLGKGRRRDGLK